VAVGESTRSVSEMVGEAELVGVDSARAVPVEWAVGPAVEPGLVDIAESAAADIARRDTVPADMETGLAAQFPEDIADRDRCLEDTEPLDIGRVGTVESFLRLWLSGCSFVLPGRRFLQLQLLESLQLPRGLGSCSRSVRRSERD